MNGKGNDATEKLQCDNKQDKVDSETRGNYMPEEREKSDTDSDSNENENLVKER